MPSPDYFGWRTIVRYLPSGINHHHDQRLAGLYVSGELAVDPSNAGTTGLLDLPPVTGNLHCWIWLAYVPIFFSCQRNRHIAGRGKFTSGGTRGLKAGTPVVVGGGDVQLGCLG